MGNDQEVPLYQAIAAYFIETYYKRLTEEPLKLSSYYSKDSSWLHEDYQAGQGYRGDEPPLHGRQAVSESLQKSNYSGSRIVVHSVHSQPSIANSVLVLVMGSLIPVGDDERSFAHSFLLAQGNEEKNYYLMNDIFMFNDGDVVQVSTDDEEDPEAANVELQPQDKDEDYDEAVPNVELATEAESTSTDLEKIVPVQESLPQPHDSHFEHIDHSVDQQVPSHSLDEIASAQGQSTTPQSAGVPAESKAAIVGVAQKASAPPTSSSAQPPMNWNRVVLGSERNASAPPKPSSSQQQTPSSHVPQNPGRNASAAPTSSSSQQHESRGRGVQSPGPNQEPVVATGPRQSAAKAQSTARPANTADESSMFLPIPSTRCTEVELQEAFEETLKCPCTILSVSSRGPGAIVVQLSDRNQANQLLECGTIYIRQRPVPCKPVVSQPRQTNHQRGYGRGGPEYHGGYGGRGVYD